MQINTQECGEIAADRRPRALPIDEIHVWHRRLGPEFLNIDSYYEFLCAEERARAGRYRFDQHRNEFILTRSTLRILAASYLNRSPEDLAFVYSAQGKPSLECDTDLRFNVSHTEGLAAMAFVRGYEIGIDVEKIRWQSDARKLAERFFSEQERRFLSGLTGPAFSRPTFSRQSLDEAFFRCWTRKEAFVKAKGGGLAIPLDEFDVSIAEGEPAALLGTRPDPAEAGRWSLHDLPIQAGYAAALAISTSSTTQENVAQKEQSGRSG